MKQPKLKIKKLIRDVLTAHAEIANREFYGRFVRAGQDLDSVHTEVVERADEITRTIKNRVETFSDVSGDVVGDQHAREIKLSVMDETYDMLDDQVSDIDTLISDLKAIAATIEEAAAAVAAVRTECKKYHKARTQYDTAKAKKAVRK